MDQDPRKRRTFLGAFRDAAATLSALRRTLGTSPKAKRVLWVDDHPENNRIPRGLLEDAGALVVSAQSTDEAVALLARPNHEFDLIISDMGRDENLIAGLELLRYLHNVSVGLPAIIYSDSPEADARREELHELGAIGPVLGPENLITEIARLFQYNKPGTVVEQTGDGRNDSRRFQRFLP
jgi:CheY-like chemotaxis protein